MTLAKVRYAPAGTSAEALLLATNEEERLFIIRHDLSHLVTRYDREQGERAARNKRAYHNPYALGLMLGAVDDVMVDMKRGKTLHQSVYSRFQDRLLTQIEKAFDLPVTYGGGAKDTGYPQG